jgi:hypothetical protein
MDRVGKRRFKKQKFDGQQVYFIANEFLIFYTQSAIRYGMLLREF